MEQDNNPNNVEDQIDNTTSEQAPLPVYKTPAQVAYQTYRIDQERQEAGANYENVYQNRQPIIDDSLSYKLTNVENIEGNRRKQTKRKTKRKKGNGGKVFLAIMLGLLFGLFAAVAFQATSHLSKMLVGNNGGDAQAGEQPEFPLLKQQPAVVEDSIISRSQTIVTSDVTAVVEKAMPSVVSITNLSVQQVEDFFGGIRSQEFASSGSGIIIGENEDELLIITNHHVIEASNTLTIYFVDDEYAEGVVKGSDPDLDLAIVAIPLENINTSTKEAISIATLGNSKSLTVGEPAIAIGNALGYGQSVTVGVISALNRDFVDSDLQSKLIQTDAAINPGNSGGALLNVNGEVIGINTMKFGGDAIEGMGYAIPVSDVSETITELMTLETKFAVPEAERGILGIRGMDVTQEFADMYNMPIGVYVTELVEGGGAQKAGLPINSVITGINDRKISNMSSLVEEISFFRVGDKVTVVFQSQGESGEYMEHKMEITLTKSDS